MPKLFHIKDNQTGKVLVRKSLDAREILGTDPGRYSPVGDAARLRPILHLKSSDDEGLPDPVAAAPTHPASSASATPRPAKKQPSQATIAKRNEALAKARAARKANRAKESEQPQAA